MKYSYFPGCSLKGTGRAYEESLLPVFRAMDIELEELEDWNCCGATAYMAVDEVKACVMASRNLAIAEKAGHKELVAPCNACYLVLNKTKHYLHESPSVKRVIDAALKQGNLTYTGNVPVRHPLDVLVNSVGLDEVKKRVKQPLKGLKVAPYYGCQIVRPYSTFDDQYNPTTMDRLLEALGATVVTYPLKTRCCGGSLTGTLPEPGLLCSYILLKEAIKRGADVVATICPLCQFNLDGYHDKIEAKWESVRIPTVYFSQLMGLAFGLPAQELGLHRGFVPMKSLPAQTVAA
ncbi:MAG TPA: CoB--CoM heterodisulfide reductase iron-sulfur subunit B family protein [Candidatus Paceibacterota bacterium]|nr:CoB--CoM heterodisulfide reductase iron-sulfur subunit B family protein [Verrucomicrobiota bacterium]HRY50817.1 CoB--CoM heterodisulfide reductase iron-sulfur subunit B family protein [Candidatus Paceibacterota bacterium]HRZ99767.1 CoB--CoM heterodisulfide reductase iron-sulfur subunit B family protein [Candidatus Paceibacterota bacterium]